MWVSVCLSDEISHLRPQRSCLTTYILFYCYCERETTFVIGLQNEMKTANLSKHTCVDVEQSLTEIARQQVMADGVETYQKLYYPGGIDYLKRTSS